MSEAPTRRAVDQGIAAVAAKTAAQTSKTFWAFFEHHHLDSLAVLVVTLGLTYQIVQWALEFSYDVNTKLSGTDKAAIIAAVMTPYGLMQAALFKFYVDLKGKSNGGSNGQAKAA